MQLKSILKIAATVIAAASVITLAGCGGDKDASASAAKSQAGSAKTYVVATRGTFRPFTYMDDKNNLTGYDVEILKEVEKRNPGIHFEFKTMAPSAGFVGMESGQVDIVANQITYNEERAAKTIYTKEVNNYTARKLAVRNDRNDINSLEDLKGKKVVLYFYPKDNTSGCTMQAVNFQATLDKFEKAGYVVIGVSRDSLKSHTNFRNKQGLKFPLLSDADSEVSKLYGVLKMKSMYGRKYLGIVRSTFVIDENGILAAEFRDVKAKTSVADLEKALGIS